jgi:Spy/CpxP family protein refolding chaperone
MLLLVLTSGCESRSSLCAVNRNLSIRDWELPDRSIFFPGVQLMKHYSNVFAALFLVAMSGMASANGFEGLHEMRGDFPRPDRLVEHLSRRLDLDDTQEQAVQNIVDAAAPEMTEIHDKAKQNREAIRGLDASDPDYGAKLANLARENGELATSATLLHGKLRAEIHAVLTPEQRAELAGNDGRREGRHKGHHRP